MHVGHRRLIDIAVIPGDDARTPGIRLDRATDSDIRNVVTVVVPSAGIADQDRRLAVSGDRRVGECEIPDFQVSPRGEIIVLPVSDERDIAFGRPVDIEPVNRMSGSIQTPGKVNGIKARAAIPGRCG